MLKLPSPFLSASVKVCFSHVMTKCTKECWHEDLGHLLSIVFAAFDKLPFKAVCMYEAKPVRL